MMFSIEGHSRNVTSVAFSPDGQTLASGSEDGSNQLWSLNATLLGTFTCQGGGSVNSVAISFDGKTLASGRADMTVRLWSAGGILLGAFEGDTPFVTSVAFTPDGTTLPSGSFDRTIRCWDLRPTSLKERLQSEPYTFAQREEQPEDLKQI